MQKIKRYLKMISPFNNMEEMPAVVYTVKKLLAFFVVYMAAAFVGEGIIIVGLSIAGFDFMHGEMPGDTIMPLLTYYGFVVYLLFAIIYCKCVEKRPIKSMGFTKRVGDYFLGAFIVVVLLVVIMTVTCVLGGATYEGVGKIRNIANAVALLGGFMVQGAAEETLCRGFLMKSLQKKIGVPLAILISSTAFAYPHFSTLFEAETQYAVLGVINLYLVSIIFSLLILCRTNIWIACGLHSIWNFILYGVFGLVLSGSNTQSAGIICFHINKLSIINGGQYGIEASVVTTIILTISVILLSVWTYKRWRNENGV